MLMSLGGWQLYRLRWKERILADITRAEQAPSVPLTGVPGRFAKVVAVGALRSGTAFYGVYSRDMPDGSMRLGADRMQVLDRTDGSPVLVDLGWVPTEGTGPAVATGPARIEGYARPPEEAHWFSPDNDWSAHRFYTLDPEAIGAALGAARVAPFVLVALGRATATPPIPAQNLPRPPNNHLQYAFTWFGLAAALVGVFAVWWKGQLADTGSKLS